MEVVTNVLGWRNIYFVGGGIASQKCDCPSAQVVFPSKLCGHFIYPSHGPLPFMTKGVGMKRGTVMKVTNSGTSFGEIGLGIL